MTIVESGWNLWYGFQKRVWNCGWNLWVCLAVAVVRRSRYYTFPQNINYPSILLLYLHFLGASSLLFSLFKNIFVHCLEEKMLTSI